MLIDWNPRYLYRKLIADELALETFLNTVCTPEQDARRSTVEGTALLVQQHPQYQELIEHFYGRWPEMLGGAITGAVDVLTELKSNPQLHLYTLTNWSAETLPVALTQFGFLSWFEGIVVSGTEKSRKPFADFYHTLFSRYHIEPTQAVFIDDDLRNIHAAQALGLHTVHFQSPEQLRTELMTLGLLPIARTEQ